MTLNKDRLKRFYKFFEDAFDQYYEKHPAWGSLHIVLADENVKKHYIEYCKEFALKDKDWEGYWLAVLLLELKTWEVRIMARRRRLFELSMQRRINYCGIFSGKGGYNQLAKALLGLMDYMPEIDVRANDLNNRRIGEIQHLQMKDPNNREQLCHQLPVSYPGFEMYYTVTEYDQPPYRSISPMRAAKALFTQSNFCKEVFEDTCKKETSIIHYPMDPQFKPTGAKYKFTDYIEQFRFKFLAVFEWSHRKDPYTLIKAFAEEFKDDKDVCLLLRAWSIKENPSKWIGSLGANSNIFWLPQQSPQVAPMYRACDAFVTSTQGEGFGQPVAEAMACGMKVIAPKSTGMLDYCTQSNSFQVEVEEKQIKDTFAYKCAGIERLNIIKPWFKCWEVNQESLQEKMRKAYRSKGNFVQKNAVKVREKYGFDNIIKEIKGAFFE